MKISKRKVVIEIKEEKPMSKDETKSAFATYMHMELTHRRPSNYSTWHRYALKGERCYMTDGDWFEQRFRDGYFRSVAYIETIQVDIMSDVHIRYAPWRNKKALCLEIEKKMTIPAYVVWHNARCNDFMVLRITQN